LISKDDTTTSGNATSVDQDSYQNPPFETSTAEKTDLTRIISNQRMVEGSDLTPIIADPEATSNRSSLQVPEFQRTYYLSTIDEGSKEESASSSREILREECQLPEHEPEMTISDQDSLPVFSPKNMTRRTTMFRLTDNSPNIDDNSEEARPASLEASEIDTGYVEDPSLDQTEQYSNSEPHMIIPNLPSGSRENTGDSAIGNGSIQVCQLVDDVKQYMSRLSGMLRINRKCSHL